VNNNVPLGPSSQYAISGSVQLAASSDKQTVYVGTNTLPATSLGSGLLNFAAGYSALQALTTGQSNVAVGANTLNAITAGNQNTAIGSGALQYVAGVANGSSTMTALGYNAGAFISGGVTHYASSFGVGNNIFIGANAFPLSNSDTSEIVIGTGTVGLGNNSTIIGNPSTTQTLLKGVVVNSNTVRLTADSSGITATTPGTIFLTFPTLPASTNLSFRCELLYSQATAVVLDGFSVQGATNAPTRLDAWGSMDVTNPTSTTYTGSKGSALNITSTTSTPVVSATPGVIGTVYQAELFGTIQVGASVPTLSVQAFTGNASDAVTVKAGSYCTLN
jgi:hypothetical protein